MAPKPGPLIPEAVLFLWATLWGAVTSPFRELKWPQVRSPEGEEGPHGIGLKTALIHFRTGAHRVRDHGACPLGHSLDRPPWHLPTLPATFTHAGGLMSGFLPSLTCP